MYVYIYNKLSWIGSQGWDIPSGFPQISSLIRQTWLPSHLGAQLNSTGFQNRFSCLRTNVDAPTWWKAYPKERASERQS